MKFEGMDGRRQETQRGFMEALGMMGFMFGMVGIVASVQVQQLTKTLKEKGFWIRITKKNR